MGPDRGPSSGLGAPRTLIVDDDPALRDFFTEMLEARGHAVVACGTAEDAWELLKAESFPLVVLDLTLPGMDGLTLCQRLRTLPHGDDSVVLVVTGRTGPGELNAVLEAGADDYLAKPFEIRLFDVRLAVARRRVAEVARRRRAEAALADQARLEGASKMARTVVDRLGNQLAGLVANADLLAEEASADYHDRAEAVARIGRRAAETLRLLGRIVRYEEVDKAGDVLLDLEASSGEDDESAG